MARAKVGLGKGGSSNVNRIGHRMIMRSDIRGFDERSTFAGDCIEPANASAVGVPRLSPCIFRRRGIRSPLISL